MSSLHTVLGGDPVRGFVWFVQSIQGQKCRQCSSEFLGVKETGPEVHFTSGAGHPAVAAFYARTA